MTAQCAGPRHLTPACGQTRRKGRFARQILFLPRKAFGCLRYFIQIIIFRLAFAFRQLDGEDLFAFGGAGQVYEGEFVEAAFADQFGGRTVTLLQVAATKTAGLRSCIQERQRLGGARRLQRRPRRSQGRCRRILFPVRRSTKRTERDPRPPETPSGCAFRFRL